MRTFTSPRPARACADKSELGTQHSPSSAELRTRLAHNPRTPKKGGTTFRTRLRRQIRTWNAASPPQAPNSERVSPIIRAHPKRAEQRSARACADKSDLGTRHFPQAPNSERVATSIRARPKRAEQRSARACADKSELGTQHSPSSAELRTRLAHHPRTSKKGGTPFRTRLRRQIRTWNATFPLKRRTQNSSRPSSAHDQKGRNHVPHALVPTNPNLKRSIPPQAPNSELVSPIHPRTQKKRRNHVPHALAPTNPNLERDISPQAPNSELVSPIIRARPKRAEQRSARACADKSELGTRHFPQAPESMIKYIHARL